MRKIIFGMTILVSLSSFAYEGQPRKVILYTSPANKIEFNIEAIDFNYATYVEGTPRCLLKNNLKVKIGNVNYLLRYIEAQSIWFYEDCSVSKTPILVFVDEETEQEVIMGNFNVTGDKIYLRFPNTRTKFLGKVIEKY